ncbi:hypothetical protein [Pelagibius sp. 7325]|uniref:hypothetical protein n=1 Tax=Pelagibius sp. 7325 TaxID=3131994 RepID=UPI0030EC9953
MLAFEILLNGETKVLAGFEDWEILSAILSARRAQEESADDDLEISVRGLALIKVEGQREHVRWERLRLSVGDEVTIRLLDVSKADAPKKRYRSDREVQENPFTDEEILEMQRETYLELKRKFEPNSGK